MGNSQNKDGFIDIFLQTKKQIYTAGQFVDGVVHVNCKDARNYRSLRVKLQGKQHVKWQQGRGKKSKKIFSNNLTFYNSSFDVAIFNSGIINAGQYSFPFKFLLSSQFPGSFYQHSDSYIRYYLSGELLPSDDKNHIQSYSKLLNVIQPPRNPFGPLQGDKITNPRGGACCCCLSNGQVRMTMTCDKNFVKPGDTVNLSGFIDNRNGTSPIKLIKVYFCEYRWRVSSQGTSRNNVLTNTAGYYHPNPVPAGSTDKFATSFTIPKSVYNSSIGSITSIYHTISLKGQMGGCCCQSDQPRTDTPKIQQVNPVQSPPIWKPMISGEVVNTSMQPYAYRPNKYVPFQNRLGANKTKANNFNNMANMNPMDQMNQINQMGPMGQINSMGQMGQMNPMMNQMNPQINPINPQMNQMNQQINPMMPFNNMMTTSKSQLKLMSPGSQNKLLNSSINLNNYISNKSQKNNILNKNVFVNHMNNINATQQNLYEPRETTQF